MKHKIIRYFNMLEIALAIAIIALGATSIMVLFPVGLASTNAAVIDNNLPDAAELLLGYIETQVQAGWRDNTGAPIAANAFLNTLSTSEPSLGTLEADSGGSWTAVAGMPDIFNGGPGIFKFDKKVTVTSQDGSTADVREFSALATVWKAPAPYTVPAGASAAALTAMTTELTTNPKCSVVIYVRLSYPADKPAAGRESRLYKLHLFNQAYTYP